MDLRQIRLATEDPDRFDRLLPATQWEIVLPLPELTYGYGEFRLVHKAAKSEHSFSAPGGLGFVRFDGPVVVRQLYEGKTLWMSDTPQELGDMHRMADQAKPGHVLIAGLGMGILATLVARKEGVEKVTVVEIAADLVAMIRPHLPQNVVVVCADFREWIGQWTRDNGSISSVLLDIWGGYNLDETLPDMLAVWDKVQQAIGRVPGEIWCFDRLFGNLQDLVMDDEFPSDTADQLDRLGASKVAQFLRRTYPDDDYGGEDYEWYDDLDLALECAFDNVYGLQC